MVCIRRMRAVGAVYDRPTLQSEPDAKKKETVMFITKKAIPRRTFLKGAQAALALPLLDAMIPAATAWARTPAKPVPRLGFVYIPMGCDHARWTPPGEAKLTELSPILYPLEPVTDQVTVMTNTRLP